MAFARRMRVIGCVVSAKCALHRAASSPPPSVHGCISAPPFRWCGLDYYQVVVTGLRVVSGRCGSCWFMSVCLSVSLGMRGLRKFGFRFSVIYDVVAAYPSCTNCSFDITVIEWAKCKMLMQACEVPEYRVLPTDLVQWVKVCWGVVCVGVYVCVFVPRYLFLLWYKRGQL